MNSLRGSRSCRSRLVGFFSSLRSRRRGLGHRGEADINEWVQRTKETASIWAISGSEELVDSGLVAQLRAHTETFLQKRPSLKPDQRSTILTELIERHPQKVIAFLACVHSLTRGFSREVLGGFQRQADQPADVVHYLRIVVATQQANPVAIDDQEAWWAKSLLALSTVDDENAGLQLVDLAASFSSKPPNLPLLDAVFYDILRKAGSQFSNQLEKQRQQNEYGKAYAACAWLSELHHESELIPVLDETFQDWRIWAAWRPNCSRLHLWESLKFDQREQIQDLIKLEGPDFGTRRMESLRQGLHIPPRCDVIDLGKITIKVGMDNTCDRHEIVGQLVDTLDAALSADSNCLTNVKQLCVDRAVTFDELNLLEAAGATGNATVHLSMLQILTDQTVSVQMAAVSRLLPALDGTGKQAWALRELVAPLLAKIVDARLKKLQEELCKRVENGRAIEVVGMNISELAQCLKKAVWLCSHLTQPLLAFAERFPPVDTFKTLLEVRNAAQNTKLGRNSPLTRAIDTCCGAQLAEGSELGDETTVVEALLPFWTGRPDRERREAALAVAQASYIQSKTRRECLSRLPRAHEKLVNGLRAIGDTDLSCVRLARVLSSPRVYDRGLDGCWPNLLQGMIENRGPGLGERILEEMRTEALLDDWFHWQGQLKKIFFHGTSRPVSLHPLLQWRFSRWIERISTQYLPGLERITSAGNRRGLMWIILGFQHPETIMPLLNNLTLSQGRPSSDQAIRPMLAALKPDGSNAQLVSDALFQLSNLTQRGTQASLRAVQLHQASGSLSEASMSGILRSAGTSPADERALRAMMAVLS